MDIYHWIWKFFFFGGVFSKIFRWKVVQIGDEHFDKQIIIRSKPKNFATQALSSTELRKRLWEPLGAGNIKVSGQKLSYRDFDIVTDVEYLQTLFDTLCELAEAIENVDAWMAIKYPLS